jgi:hypothetical protein
VAPQSPSSWHPDDDAVGEYGTDYASGDFLGRRPVKKPKTDGVRAAGGGARREPRPLGMNVDAHSFDDNLEFIKGRVWHCPNTVPIMYRVFRSEPL